MVIKAAKDMFKNFSNGNKSAIHPGIRNEVFRIVLKSGGGQNEVRHCSSFEFELTLLSTTSF